MSAFDRIKRFLGLLSLPSDRLNTIPTVEPREGRPMDRPPAKPNLKGLSEDERSMAITDYRLAYRQHFAAIAAFNRKHRVSLGISEYIWRMSRPEPDCDIARRNNEKTFSYLHPPPEGHVCEGQCNSVDWCRCTAQPKVKGFS